MEPLRRMLSSLIFITFSVWLLLCFGMFALQPRFVYFPSRTLELTPADLGIAYQDIIVKKPQGGQIHGWFIPHEEARYTVLMFHGNGGNISHRMDLLELFRELKLSVFLVDYSGYGKSDGVPSEQGTYDDAQAAWDWLTGVKGVEGNQVILYGESLGGAVAAWLAGRVKPAALVLQSTFTSLVDVGRHLYPYLPVRWLLHIRYPTIDRIGDIYCPVLVAHGPGDEIIPYAQGKALYAAANAPKDFLELTGRHNEAVIESEREFIAGMQAFLEARL
jgi:hypothetical protein